MSLIDWFLNLPPASLTDTGVKMLIYLLVIFTFLSALVVFFATRYYRKKDSPSLLDLDFETDIPTPSDIPPSERIAILNIEKAKSIAAQRALSDAHKKKEVSEAIFGRLSVRYASDVKKIEDEIEKTTREAEVSQLEEELKKMQGDYLSKIKGEEKIEVTPSTPSTAPPAPPVVGSASTPPMPAAPTMPAPTPPMPAAPTMPAPIPTMPTPKPAKPKKEKKKKDKKDKKAATPPTPPTPGKAAPPPPPGLTSTPPGTAVPSPPMPTPLPGTPVSTPSIPAPTVPTPKPPGIGAPAPAVAPPAAGEGEGDLFAKSTSIAALRKEMLKELDRLKKFMSEQQ